MSLRNAAHPIVQWDIQREVQIVRRRQAAGLHLEGIRAEWLERLRVSQTVFASAEIAIPIAGELIVRELAGIGDQKWHRRQTGRARGNIYRQRKQIPSRSRAELIALYIQKTERHRIHAWHAAVGLHGCDRLPVRHGNVWNRRIDECSRRGPAALPSALVIHVEISQLRFLAHRSAQVAAKDVLLNHHFLQEEVRGVQRRIAEIFPSIAVKAARAALQRGVDVASAIASLRSSYKLVLTLNSCMASGFGKGV